MGEIIIGVVLICASGIIILKKDSREAFMSGAEDGARNALRLAPAMIVLMGGVGMLRVSGFADISESLLRPFFEFAGIPEELISFLAIRPFSGAGGISFLTDIYAKYGPDSFVGMCASVISASSDTVLYIIPVYFAHAGKYRSRYAIPLALAVSVVAVLLSVILVRLFGYDGA